MTFPLTIRDHRGDHESRLARRSIKCDGRHEHQKATQQIAAAAKAVGVTVTVIERPKGGGDRPAPCKRI